MLLNPFYLTEPPKKATALTEEPLPVHSKSNTDVNTSICLYFMHITCKKNPTANLKLTDNLIVLPDTSTLVYGELCRLT
jgi:hypothetical protein